MRKVIAAIIIIAVGLAALVAALPLILDAIELRALSNLAQINVKLKTKDYNATFENVVVHRPGPSVNYVCGYYRPSYDSRATPKRFLYHGKPADIAFSGVDQRLDALILDICNRPN